jgi:hypothetical protein
VKRRSSNGAIFVFIGANLSLLTKWTLPSLLLLVTLLLFPVCSDAQLRLAWDPNTEADLSGYRVYYGTASRTYGSPIDVGNVTTHTLNGLTPGVIYYITVTAYDASYSESDFSNEVSGAVSETTNPPNVLTGPTSGVTGTSYSYTTGGASSSLGHNVEYQFDWTGNGTDLSPWGAATRSKTWTAAGTYNVRTRARCVSHTNMVSQWFGPLTATITATTSSCTVTTNPSGLQIVVDGTSTTAPQTFLWTSGSSHTLSTPTPQSGSAGTRFNFSQWSNGGSRTQTVIAPSSNTTYTASFTTQYGLATSVAPAEGGTVSPSGTNWYNSGDVVSVRATANSGYAFSNWSGDLSGTTTPGSVAMSAPRNVIANFILSTVALLSPNGGDVLWSGSTYTIQWIGSSGTATFTLMYSTDGGVTWTLIKDGIAGTRYDWLVPPPAGNKNQCLVKVTGYDASGEKVRADSSDSPFSIEVVKMTSPNGGESIPSGTASDIKWTTHATKSSVYKAKLFYTKNGGKTWNLIKALDGNPGSHEWVLSPLRSSKSKCKVKVVLTDAQGNTLGTDASDGFFAIQPSP